MRIPLRSAAWALGTGAVVLVAASAWGVARWAALEAMYGQGERRLAAATALGAEQVRASRGLPLDSVAGALALATGYRVSVFDSEMALLADSDLGPATPDTLPDRSGRSEVEGALLRVDASARRTSLLDGQRYLFGATRLYREGESVVVRFGDPVGPMRDAAARVARLVGAGVLAGGLVVLVLIHRAAGGVAGSLGRVTRLLTRLAAGRPPGPRIKLSGVTELARLASSANRVRAELEEQVGQVSRERDELAQLMDEVAEGLMALTSDARVLLINSAARRLLGVADVPSFAPVGSIVRDPVLRDLLEASVVRAEGRLEVGIGGRELEVRTKMGAAGGSVVLLVDVTEMRRLEAVRTDFVANASHELKTPLTVIRAAAETVMDEDLPRPLRHKFLESIEGNTVRLQRLVDDLLDLSRYESGEWRPARERVEIDRVARAAWQELAAAAGRSVEFDVAGGGAAVGDEAALYQIFRNLFENSLRYVPEDGGRIGVEIGSSGPMVVVAVRDDGSGIPAASLPRIFERFYRVDAARSRQEGGTGLGLAIVRHLVSSMGGEVAAESNWGSGTTVTFSVPRRLGPAERGRDRPSAVTGEAAGPLRRAGGALTLLSALLAGCSAGDGDGGSVLVVGGSSSLYPLSAAVAEDYAREHPGSRIVVRVSGTAGGMRRLCEGEIHIAGASRPMTSAEAARCRSAGIGHLAIPVARDGVAVVVNAGHDAVGCLTLTELRRLWAPGGGVATWRDLRPGLPAERIRLFGPGTASGTYRFFTAVVMGRAGASRADHYQSEDDHLIARGVAGSRWSLGYLGSASHAASEDRVRALAVDAGFGCVRPTPETIGDGSYGPLARDLYIYVSDMYSNMYRFVVHYVTASQSLAVEAGYAPLPAGEYERSLARLASMAAGPS